MAQCPACKFRASTNFLQPTYTMSKRLKCVPTVLKKGTWKNPLSSPTEALMQ